MLQKYHQRQAENLAGDKRKVKVVYPVTYKCARSVRGMDPLFL